MRQQVHLSSISLLSGSKDLNLRNLRMKIFVIFMSLVIEIRRRPAVDH